MMTRRFVIRVLGKTLLLFALFNVVYYIVQPLPLLDHLSVYNTLVPGRLRMPYADYPNDSYNISILRLDELLNAHEIARPKASDEYRVVMIGDSSVWGYLLQPTQTQAVCLDHMGLALPSGKKVRVYNLGYPILSVTKDVLILQHVLAYHPDLIVWSTTLASLYPTDQLGFLLIQQQYDELESLINQYHLTFTQPLTPPTLYSRTFFGQRRAIANWFREQLYGLAWNVTGVDHVIERFVQSHPTNLAPDDNIVSVNVMHLKTDHKITPDDLSFDVVDAGLQIAQQHNVPVLLVNEPIYRGQSDLRWNYYYPKWAYDNYRDAFQAVAQQHGWHYADFWDVAPNDQFTDTDFHLTAQGNCAFAEKLRDPLMQLATASQ